ncbi:MAG: hypothetical protein KF842_00435 [Caulobacter sp.]|nr:hypothetical protein [Caulobacter sp.]
MHPANLRTAAAAGLVLAALLGPSASISAEKRMSVSFSQGERNGVCMVGFKGPAAPGGETPLTLQITYRVKDGNVGATLLTSNWKRAQDADPEENFQMTLVFDTGRTSPARSGGYDSGFNDTAWAGWGAGAASDDVMRLLEKARTARVLFDGMDIGPFDMQMAGLAHNTLNSCAERVRAAAQ